MPRKLSRLLAGDLDTIVLKALRKEPERRYASVDEMADDIRRHLAGHTVSARPDTLRYRVSRFARRNRILVGSVAAVFTALTVGLAASYLQYQNAERARVRETLQRAEAERLAYRSGLLAAESSIRTNHLLEARRQLEAAPAHLRGWEWRHLAARLDHSLLSIPAHDGAVTAVAWGHDGQIFTSGEDRMVRMWDAQSGAARGDLGPFESAPRSLDVGASGAHIAVGFEEGHVAVIALGGGETVELRDPNPMAYVRPTPPPQEDSQIATLNLPATWPHVDFHPQGAELATGFYSGFVQIWNPQTRDTISARPQEHGGDKTLVGWSPSGAELIVGSGFDPPCLVDAATLKVVRKFPGSGGQVDFRFTRDGKRLAVAYHDGHRITVWDAESGAESVTLHTPGGSLRAVDFDAKGDHLVSASTGGGLAVWDLSTGRVVAQLLGHTADVQCLATSTDGSRIATGDWDGMLKVWSWDTQDVQVLHLPSGGFRRIWADALSLAPDGERFVTNLTGVSLLLWDLRAHRLISRLAIHDPTTRRRALRLAWSRDGRRALAGLEDGTLEFVDVAAGRVEREVAVGAQGVQALDIHPSLPRCVVGFGDSIEIRSIETGECIDRLIGHAAEVLVARFGPDGRWLATAGVDRTVRLWDVRTGTCGHVLTGHTDRVCDVAFSPDVAWLVSASWDGTVRLWDTRTGRCAKTLYRGDRRMYGVAFTHDGTRVAAAGFDGVVRLFDPAAGFEVAQLHGHEGRVFALAFTPDDTALISTSLDGTVRIWEAPPAEPP